MQTKTVQLPTQVTRAIVQPQTIDRDARTIEVVWTTGARGLRSSWDGKFYEELSLDPSHLNLSRLKNRAQVLDTHNKYDGLSAVIGVVEDAWIVSGTEARAKLRLSGDERKAGTVQDILDGIIANLSVGYSIERMEQVGIENDIPVLRATAWTPFELSFVPVPFDAGAQSRSDENNTRECTILINAKDETMDENEKMEAERQAAQAPKVDETRAAPSSHDGDAIKRAIEADRTRGIEIAKIVTKAGLERDLADSLFAEGKSLEQVRAIVLDKLCETSERTAPRVTVSAGSLDEKSTAVRAMEETLLCRAAPTFNKPTELSQRYRSYSLLEMAKESLHMQGVRTMGWSRNEIAARALHTTTDFPLILGNTVRKVLKDNFATAPSDYAWMTRPITVNDYKSISRFGLSTGPALLEVKEAGEYKRGTFTEEAESMQLKKFGRIVGITREVIINDDVNAFADVPRMWGFGAQQLIAKLVWEQITANPTMSDGIPLFHASHGNLMVGGATTGVLNVDNLEVAVSMIESQQGFASPGEDPQYLNLQARYLIVGPALKYAAIRLTTAVTPIAQANVNPFANLIVKSDPRITGSQWFVTADPAVTDAIGLLQMAGEEGPQLDERVGFDVDGIEYKVRLDTGAKMLGYRWIVKNPGV